jgi:hypothetical protein
VACEEYAFSAQSVGRLASTLTLLIRNHALALPDDGALLDELANLRLPETSPGVFRIEHDPDKHDDMAIALALAAQKLARVPQLQADPPEPPEDPDPRRRHLLRIIEKEQEWDEWVGCASFLDRGELPPLPWPQPAASAPTKDPDRRLGRR